MRKIIILILAITLSSCSNESFKVENPEKETTVEIQKAIDYSNLYAVVETEEGSLQIINAETSLLEYKALNYTGLADTLGLIILSLIIAIFSISIWKD